MNIHTDKLFCEFSASQRLSEMLRQPYDLYKGGWCDQYIMGLVNQVAQAMDDAISQEVIGKSLIYRALYMSSSPL